MKTTCEACGGTGKSKASECCGHIIYRWQEEVPICNTCGVACDYHSCDTCGGSGEVANENPAPVQDDVQPSVSELPI